jgi:two-component system chemotaxis sensor kinase CheA
VSKEETSDDICFAEFLDDYYVECEEHLAVSRQSLLALESFVDHPHIDRHLLDELFRSFHSLKGLSAMVGVHEAEQLAHQMESYLSVLRKEQSQLTATGVDSLIEGVKTLDQIIVSRRENVQPRDIRPLLVRLESLLTAGEPSQVPSETGTHGGDPNAWGLSTEKSAELAAALQKGARAWQFTFTPSPVLAGREINVNTVRQRLQKIGDLIHAAPHVKDHGQISFVFLVTSLAEEETFRFWQQDGLTYDAYEAPISPPVNEVKADSALDAGTGTPLAPSNIVRVDLGRLDELMRLVGELVISRSRLDEGVKRAGTKLPAPECRALQETNQAIERQLRDLREGVMRVRLVPVRDVFARMQFVVRDLIRESGKKVAVELSGQETEIDKYVVERMMDPLLHLVRNAVSHGLELPKEREAQGKSSEGKLFLRASTTGETIAIEVEDDGRGLDAQAILHRAQATGRTSFAEENETITLLDVICTPGFSTRDEADRASGRGVGMAVVRTVAEELGGSVALDTRPGFGAKFTIQLPLTLAIADALIIDVGGQMFAIPQASVHEVIQVDPKAVTLLENNELVPYHNGVLPLLRLANFFGMSGHTDTTFFALVINSGLSAVGLTVDRVLGLREIVVRPLTDAVIRVPGVSGATELGDGRVVLILDATALARAARKQTKRNWATAACDPPADTALYVDAGRGELRP